MLSFNRRILLFLPLALAACGFSPVYGPGGTASALRGKVQVAAPDTTDAYQLVQNLEQRLGQPDMAIYALSFTLKSETQGQAITVSNETTRYSLVGKVDYILRANEGGDIVASGSVDNFTGYSATGSTVETLAAERDARARLMVILADQITTRLYATANLPQ
ncbi:MAG: LPS assembly lipoprotein LptE [Rhodobacteraceae bacterium]|nr:LPS assembly lipoprotein LptE [Paracoccaceae bacterium]